MSQCVRLVVAEDDPLMRKALVTFFSRRSDMEVVGQARTGVEAVDACEQHRPDLVLMDLDLPHLSGSDATRQITQRWPEITVLVLTTFDQHDQVVAALRAGAAGYLLKDASAAALVAGVHQAMAGEMPLSARVRQALVAAVVADGGGGAGGGGDAGVGAGGADPSTTAVVLTTREAEALRWLTLGLTNAEIGARMFTSEGSVKQYLSGLGTKLGVTSRTAILIRAIQLGLVDPRALPPASGTSVE